MQQLKIFDNGQGGKDLKNAPLAERLRPHRMEDFVGQGHLLGKGKILDRLLQNRQYQSLIFWGPPGCGKTTLAQILAMHSQSHFIHLSAVMAGTREIRSAVEEAREIWVREKKRTWLFMDEVHRLNKAQQDTLLPHVENGTVLFLGATTENPSFEIIRPLLSRAQVLVLQPLEEEDLRTIVERALQDKELGLGRFPAQITEDSEQYLFAASGGDARVLLNALEIAVLTTAPSENGVRTIDLNTIHEALQRGAIHYDKAGEEHFNLISALHKSIRGSDPDAALYWLARMLEAGEDPLYIARRLIRVATEDVGLADPLALMEAIAGFQTYQLLGSPEGELALAQVAVYLSLASKSNSVYVAFDKAREIAKKTGGDPVPLHLRNAPTALLRKLGYGRNYRYPHDFPEGWIAECYMPESLKETKFYRPNPRGWEGKWQKILEERRKKVEEIEGSG